MDCCPICGTRTADNPEQCPECGAPLAPNRLEPEEAVFDPVRWRPTPTAAGGFGRLCLAVGMFVSLLHCVGAVVVGLALALHYHALLGVLVGLLGFCVSVAQFVVFRKVHELYDFTPQPDTAEP